MILSSINQSAEKKICGINDQYNFMDIFGVSYKIKLTTNDEDYIIIITGINTNVQFT